MLGGSSRPLRIPSLVRAFCALLLVPELGCGGAGVGGGRVEPAAGGEAHFQSPETGSGGGEIPGDTGSPGANPPGDSVIGFTRWREPREVAWIGLSGVREVRAGGLRSQVAFSRPERGTELRSFARAYAPFRLRTAEGELILFGRGPSAAKPAEQRMLLEWARRVMVEAIAGGRTEAFGLVFSWHRGVATAALCDEVSVYLDGEARAGPCLAASPVREVRGRLDAERLARLYGWYDSLQPFQADGLQGVRADAALERVTFAGRGKSAAQPGEIAAIGEMGARLFRQLTAPPPASPQPIPPPPAPAGARKKAPEAAHQGVAGGEKPATPSPPPATWR